MQLHNRQQQRELRRQLRRNSSPPEVILWARLRRGQLGCRFRRQHGIGPYIVDFYCAKHRLVVEIDGAQHTESQKAIDNDQSRESYIRSRGLHIIRFTGKEVNEQLESVIETLLQYLA